MQTRERSRGGVERVPAGISDGVLAQRTLAGDQRAFEGLVQRYSAPLFNFIFLFLHFAWGTL